MDPRNNQIGELNNFIYTRCYAQLCDDVSEALNRPLSAVLHQRQYSITVDEDSVTYSFFAWAEYVPDEDGEDIRVTCRISFDGTGYSFATLRVQRENDEWPQYDGVRVDQNLIPRLHADEMREAEAERFLTHYCPAALAAPTPVPIRTIMERMGLTVISNIQLLDGANAKTMFIDEEELVVDKKHWQDYYAICFKFNWLTEDQKKELLPRKWHSYVHDAGLLAQMRLRDRKESWQ